MTTGFRDIHAHFVYGVDDGAKSLQDMQAMLDEAYLGGIKVMYATSHSTPGIHDFPEKIYRAHLDEAKAYCAERGYDICLYAGTEILYTPALKNYMERKPLRTLEGTDCVLIEFVPDVSFAEIDGAVTLVENAGYIPILAHVERYACLFSRKIYRLKKEHDVRYQVNCGTVVKGLGFFKTWRLHRWFKDELIDYVASDMHDLKKRRNRMGASAHALKQYCSQAYIARLMGGERPLG